MRIPSGKTDQLIAFVAVDSTDLKTRKTGLSGFVVYRSRNGAAPVLYTTPTITELSAANMPGLYVFTVDEDTTIAAGSDSEEYVVHITVATMQPVTRAIELYRRDTTSGRTFGITAAGAIGVDGINTASFVAGAVNSTVAPNLDAAVSSRMATYVQPTGFLAATFPAGTIANTTNITAGTITTVTNLTNLPTIPANWLTAAGTAADFGTEIAAAVWQDAVAGDFIVASSIGRSLYTSGILPGAAGGLFIAGANAATTVNITGNLTGNVTGSVGSVTAAVTVGTINANVITAASIATDAIDADALAANAVTEIWAGSTAPTAAVIAAAVLDEDMTAHQTQGSLGQAIGDPVADTNTIYKAVVTDATGATVGIDVVAIQADTDNIQTRLPAALVGGRMDSSVGAMAVDVITAASIQAGAIGVAEAPNLDAAISTRATPAQVNTEVVDALSVDAYGEPTGAPAASATLAAKIGLLHEVVRNKITVTSTAKTFFDDASVAQWSKALSDDGTTYTEAEGV